MLRTSCVFVGGALLGFVVLGGLIWVTFGSHGLGILHLYLLAILTGAAVGGFVGFFQKNKPGLMAVLCLLPGILFEYLTVSGQGLFFLLVGSVLELSAAFTVAYAVSKRVPLHHG